MCSPNSCCDAFFNAIMYIYQSKILEELISFYTFYPPFEDFYPWDFIILQIWGHVFSMYFFKISLNVEWMCFVKVEWDMDMNYESIRNVLISSCHFNGNNPIGNYLQNCLFIECILPGENDKFIVFVNVVYLIKVNDTLLGSM